MAMHHSSAHAARRTYVVPSESIETTSKVPPALYHHKQLRLRYRQMACSKGRFMAHAQTVRRYVALPGRLFTYKFNLANFTIFDPAILASTGRRLAEGEPGNPRLCLNNNKRQNQMATQASGL